MAGVKPEPRLETAKQVRDSPSPDATGEWVSTGPADPEQTSEHTCRLLVNLVKMQIQFQLPKHC